MRRYSLTAVAVALLLAPVAATCAEIPWTLVREKDGIQVTSRPVPGSAIHELRAVGRIRSDVASLVRIITDVPAQTRWIPACTESMPLPGAASGAQRIYRRFHSPWPFQDADHIVDQTVSPPGEAGEVTVEFREAKDGPGKRKECGRMREYRGSWRFVPTRDGHVEVAYAVHFVPESATFSAIINASMGRIGWETFHGLRDFAAMGR